ncbi:2-oxoglutarate dehydrogenase complex dihydrolipoyllysine-residue succinyltransferase [Sphingomonas histidinilytica]|jgi:2-oxoglutarate dehydrogenase E2 component (dihydrolipoamide succinyltransferase)|uniref:Dihydrolipoyllysine-residue succinyltransferase component of 2-oxoglutarate dehydrogenase complex n=1 Tax=Rhizorhabdus histidinilytica TaxID=439228 RepID=A0A1T5C0A6_9SPHN|nr:2-oxoglutarate dehydrogenase complex dihydrolipoyllysine-residue succinyltransferase [Rhizorhabdus histidinilytica]MBO9375258.1 2-oxoglutarate dehydrogenase complex dihydrolipoyllysine-residue succinyltransferase [Rhizorhabdus histidinilytica]QEH77367.1 2-oxoglutarate dehydrogenase complex dihydrolipoyllysine-residue succinyltransferase [Sphingomonas sp. C8-2]SKB52836.1 2-oxoglutarate dehydrogenase E2 component [Rhizorhabdus histidinilytica]
MATDVVVPTLGESITEATLGQWLKKPGEAVKADEPIASLETDKVSVEVPAPTAGVIAELVVGEGDTVNVGAVIARIDAGATASTAATPAVEDRNAIGQAEAAAPAEPAAAPVEEAGDPVTLSPSVRRAVLEHGVDPSKIKGTGKDGRLTKDDVIAAAKTQPKPAAAAAAPAAAPVAVAAPAGERREERVRMTRLRQTVASRLKEAQNTAAILTTFNDVDMTAVIEARNKYKDLFEKKHGVRLGFMGFFVKAACMALRDVPAVNASIEGDEIVYRDYVDVSVAVSAPNGLVVPVIRDAQDLSVAGIEKTIGDFGARAKAGTLKLEEMKGGTFTISNGGVFGSLMSTPIINPPQAGVLGLHRIEERPVVRDGQIVARPMMYLALSYDHRLIDGREAVTFLVAIKNAIEDPTRLLIDL